MPSESSFSGKVPPWNADNISHCDQLSFLNTVSYWETMLTLFSTALSLKFAFVYYMEFIFKDRYKRPLIFLKTHGFIFCLLFIYFFLVFQNKISLCISPAVQELSIPGWPWTHRDLPSSVSPSAGIKGMYCHYLVIFCLLIFFYFYFFGLEFAM